METRLSNKTAKAMKLTKETILESSYKFLQVKSKYKTLKRSVYILRAFEFWASFDIQIDITLPVFWKRVMKLHFLESPQKSLETR